MINSFNNRLVAECGKPIFLKPLAKHKLISYNGNRGDYTMKNTIKNQIQAILKTKGTTQTALAEKIGITYFNLNNKMKRDNFSTIETCEIADVLGMELLLRDKETGEEYIIDYPDDQKFQPKRNDKK